MAQPVDKTRWATDGGADITDPSSGQRDIGWADGDDVDAGIFNSLLHNYYEWFQYLKNLTSEALTWVALQTFDAGVVMNKPSVGTALEINGEDGTSFRANHVIINGSNYTGVGTGSQHGVAFSVFGGTGGSATGQGAGQFTGGDSSTGSGGYGARSFGGDGVTGGDGLQAEGGNSTTNDGPAGLTGTGGTSTGTGVNGPGLKGIGQDSDVQTGLGVTARGGDLIDISGTLAHGGYVEQGDVYTDSGKGTRGTPTDSKPALEILPGIKYDGAIRYSNNGLRVSNKATVNAGGFEHANYGISLDDGLFLQYDALDTGAYPAGTVLNALPQGVLTPWGILGASCRIRYSNTGGVATIAFEATSDRFNVSSISYTSGANTFSVNFAQPFLGTSTYFVAMTPMDISSVTPGKYRPYLSAHAASAIGFRFWDSLADLQVVDMDAGVTSGTILVLDILCFGR